MLQAVTHDKHNGYEMFAKKLEQEAKNKHNLQKLE